MATLTRVLQRAKNRLTILSHPTHSTLFQNFKTIKKSNKKYLHQVVKNFPLYAYALCNLLSLVYIPVTAKND